MTTTLICLSGYAGSGKDTVADYMAEHHGFEKHSFADPLREALYRLNPEVSPNVRYADAIDRWGYDEAKMMFPEIRRLLQRLGTDVGRELWGDDFWVRQLAKSLPGGPGVRIVIPDARFQNEVQLADAMRYGHSVRIDRSDHGPANDHPSETALDDWKFDHHIYNEGTLEELYAKIDSLLDYLI